MQVHSLFQPKRKRAFVAAVAIGGLAAAIGLGIRWWRGWSPGDVGGIIFGVLAGGLMVLAAAYAARRRLLLPPLTTGQDWLQLHVYGSTLAALFVIVHMGFHWPRGQFGWWLLGLTLWTTVSGLAGVWLQKWVPALIASQLSVEVIYERVPELLERLHAEAVVTVDGSSDALQRFYKTQVEPALSALSPSWGYVLDAGRGRAQRLAPFDHIESFVDEDERTKLADLKAILKEKLEIEAHYSLQGLLRFWPIVHVPPAMLLLAAVGGHLLAVWYF